MEKLIEQYKKGAEKLLRQLKKWEITGEEAIKFETNARLMWFKECNLPKKIAKEVWQEEIIELILAEDPTFMYYNIIIPTNDMYYLTFNRLNNEVIFEIYKDENLKKKVYSKNNKGDNMTVSGQVYKCEVCGNVVSVIQAGQGELVCCEQPMNLLEEKTAEAEGKEKHVPVIEKTDKGVKVTVGSTPHPMEDAHYISLIQLVKDGNVVIGKRLNPGDDPVAEFCLVETDGLKARAFCNIHGLWIN